MRFKPPPADPLKQKKEEQKRARRAALIPVLAALPLVVGVGIFTFFQSDNPPPPQRPNAGELIAGGGLPGMGIEAMPGMFVAPGVNDDDKPVSVSGLMAVHPRDRVLEGEPAELPPMNQPGATRISGVLREADGVGEAMSIWSVAATPEQVMAHYESQARAAGFVKLTTRAPRPIPAATQPMGVPPTTQPYRPSPGTAGVTTLWLRSLPVAAGNDAGQTPDSRQGPQSLVVRAWPESAGRQRVMIWLRYNSKAPSYSGGGIP